MRQASPSYEASKTPRTVDDDSVAMLQLDIKDGWIGYSTPIAFFSQNLKGLMRVSPCDIDRMQSPLIHVVDLSQYSQMTYVLPGQDSNLN